MDRNRAVLLVLLVIFGFLSVLIVLPFLQYVLLGILLAYVIYPAYVRLAPRLGPRVAALALMVVSFVLIVLPFIVIIAVAIDQGASVVAGIQSGEIDVTAIESVIDRYVGVQIDLEQLVTNRDFIAVLGSVGDGGTMDIVGNVANVLGNVTDAVVGLAITTFLLYYLLKDGATLFQWVRNVSPLTASIQDDLYEEVNRIMWAVIVGNVMVAVVQGILTGIGFAIIGISNVVFWTLMTTALSLLPLIGASVVWLPAAIYLLLSGELVGGTVLMVYGALVISLSDNYLRPLLVDRSAHLNPAVIIVGIFGGVYAFGFMGLFFGPIVLGVVKAVLVLATQQRDRPRRAAD